MIFKSATERLNHPQAGLIPKSIWNIFYHLEIDDSEVQLFQVPQSALIDTLKMNGTITNLKKRRRYWLCTALSQPPKDTPILAESKDLATPLDPADKPRDDEGGEQMSAAPKKTTNNTTN